MRVTQNSNFNAVRDSVHRTKSRMEELQNKAATMKKLNAPSDDPVGSSKILEVRTEKINNDQFAKSAKQAESLLNHSDHALEQLSEVVIRAKEIAINQSSGASSTDETRIAVAEEVQQLFQQALGAANTKIGDRFLFGGYQTSSPVVDNQGNYLGDDGQILTEIARDVFLPANVPGIEVFNTNPKISADGRRVYKDQQPQEPEQDTNLRSPASLQTYDNEEKSINTYARSGEENVNLFRELQNLRISLLTGDLEGIRSTLERFDEIHANVIGTRAKIGARVSGLQSTIQALDRHNITNAYLTSSIEDADMAEVMSNIAREETVLNGVLAGSKKLVMPTLMDFLR